MLPPGNRFKKQASHASQSKRNSKKTARNNVDYLWGIMLGKERTRNTVRGLIQLSNGATGCKILDRGGFIHFPMSVLKLRSGNPQGQKKKPTYSPVDVVKPLMCQTRPSRVSHEDASFPITTASPPHPLTSLLIVISQPSSPSCYIATWSIFPHLTRVSTATVAAVQAHGDARSRRSVRQGSKLGAGRAWTVALGAAAPVGGYDIQQWGLYQATYELDGMTTLTQGQLC